MTIFIGQSLPNKVKVEKGSESFPVVAGVSLIVKWQGESYLYNDEMITREDYGGTCMGLHI